jgi:hypothetical protein
MKTYILLPTLLFSSISFSQKSAKSVEVELKNEFEKIYYWNEHPKTNDAIDTYDSIQTANNYILNEIIARGHSNPDFFTYPFTSLSAYLDVLTSKDKLLRIYSWDTYTGGTMHIFYAVAQYIGGDKKLYTQSLVDTSDNDPGLSFSKIYTFDDKGRKYYLSIGNAIYSTHDLAQEVIIYTVSGNLLVQAPIIKTQRGLTNSIHVGYDLFGLTSKTDHSIVFDEATKELKIPLVDAKGRMTSKNIVYKFNGERFERK